MFSSAIETRTKNRFNHFRAQSEWTVMQDHGNGWSARSRRDRQHSQISKTAAETSIILAAKRKLQGFEHLPQRSDERASNKIQNACFCWQVVKVKTIPFSKWLPLKCFQRLSNAAESLPIALGQRVEQSTGDPNSPC